ncbi:MAG: formate C-acetyltransferase/glycerol dehydratase family glycyl radical enzyme [Lachnospiraceae bacterium]|nr:formate C-acetyltransferase/glycerol dehydratase family glycyl radical enzyme [Lachnospiraceae bacterium]
MQQLFQTDRISYLKEKMLSEPRYASIEQALIITDTYKKNEDQPRIIQRALSLKAALEQMKIAVEPEELIVGNRTAGVRYGVVFPESGSTWVDREFETLPTRPQDRFHVHEEDIQTFREVIKPYWEGKSLEDVLNQRYGKEINEIGKVVKINQKDHAQGHICPNCVEWLQFGPAGYRKIAEEKLLTTTEESKKLFYQSVAIVMEGAQNFMMRYHDLMCEKAALETDVEKKASMMKVAENCKNLSVRPAQTFHEAVQATWFLFVILQMESNASSFSPGRLDRHLISYYEKDLADGTLNKQDALEIIENMWLKFNEIVYMRNSGGAKYFAGFPIGFNIAVGGQDENGNDYANELSFLFLKAQQHIGLPQPNLSVRLHEGTGDELLKEAVRTVALGSGMPQFFNDKAVIPSIMELGIEEADARDYAIVGCVELTTQGNNLGWSDSAMFNLNKALEVTLTGGTCLLTGDKIAPDYGRLTDYETFEDLEEAFKKQIDYFVDKMILACEQVEQAHIDLLPSPFLSATIDNCMENGIDVTAGGAKYNLSGIQMIQVANLADSFAAIKQLVYEEKRFTKEEVLNALKNNFEGYEYMRQVMLNKVPKYGNDISYVDDLGTKWATYFKDKLRTYTNYRGGPYHTGMYTVSAHVPMGENVGATPDGRFAKDPLADGGMSPVYGRDVKGPTAVLKSVSKLDKNLTTNGGLLNMKFLPEFFSNEVGIQKFANFLRSFVDLEIPHIQFNVVRKEDLIAAKENPEQYRGLTVRVAGYTAYFTELADELQNEIIARTSYGDI